MDVLVYAETLNKFKHGFQIAQTRLKVATSNSNEFVIPLYAGQRVRWDYYHGIRTGTITHWMLLPNPPKENL